MSTQEQALLLLQSEMSNKLEQLIKTPVSGNNDSFNFELWARAVRPQLLAALQKKPRSSKKAIASSNPAIFLKDY